MNWKEAVKYCEERECGECLAYGKDCRTKEEILNHVPCLINLVDEELRSIKFEEE